MVKPMVAVLMGSDSDLPKLEGTIQTLREFEIPFTVDVISAHRTPARAHDFAVSAEAAGYKVIICAAGGAAHLAGVIASLTTLPVIGIPMPTADMGGLDSLLATVQMPTGVPVATVAVGMGGSVNAAVLAAQIVATGDAGLRQKLAAYKTKLAESVAKKSDKIRKEFGG